MGTNARTKHDDHDGWNRDRELEDRSEGDRHGDHPHHDRQIQAQRDRYATGQSGYSAGRSAWDDRSLDYQNRNTGGPRGGNDDRQVFGTDDRFTGRRGGGDVARAPRHGGYDPERQGVPGGYAGGHGWEAERIGQRESYGDRNYDRSFGDRGADRGIYDHRGDDRSFRSRDYGPGDGERGIWSTTLQHGDERGGARGAPHQRAGEHRGKGPRGYTRSDERIKETVCEALTEDGDIDASGIDVEVANGEVTLSGRVPDRRMKRMAEDLVEGLGGVRDVTNQLKVGGDERQTLGRAQGAETSPGNPGNLSSNGAVSTDDPRKADDKKARA